MKTRLISLLAASLLLTACAIHKIDVQQGNVLTRAVVEQVKPGMSQKQVKFLLGNPAISDPFDPNRWDYPFSYQSGKKGTALERYHVTVFFDGDNVIRVTTDMPEMDIPVKMGTSSHESQSPGAATHSH